MINPLPSAPAATDAVDVFDAKAFAFAAALVNFVTQANALATDVQKNADVTAALALGMALPNYGGTSTSNLTIGTGAVSVQTQAGKSWVAGQVVVISNGGNYMKGSVTAYGGTQLDVNVTTVVGAGTFASWTIGLSYAGLALAASGANNDITSLLAAIQKIVYTARSDVASAATVNLTNANDDVRITGSTGITGFTIPVGRVVRVTFGGALTLTNNASIVTQKGANIVTQAGDTCVLRAISENTVEVLSYAPGAAPPILHIQHQTSSGTPGGSNTAGAYNTRPLNTIITNTISGASLSANQITLPAGTYDISAEGSLYAGASIRTRLRNVTDSVTTLLGTSDYSNQSSITTVKSTVVGRFTIAAQKTFEVQHYIVGTGGGASALGGSSSSGENEVFANVIIRRY